MFEALLDSAASEGYTISLNPDPSPSPSPSPNPNPDQVWAKPPGAPPLVFHRDSPYFDFAPSDVVTVAPS